MNRIQIESKIIEHLSQKHGVEVTEDTELDDIGETCDFTLMFELAELFGADDRCDGDEIGEFASVRNAVDAIESIL